jgi:hypothetical protein
MAHLFVFFNEYGAAMSQKPQIRLRRMTDPFV